MNQVHCQHDRHAEAIRAIFNDAIANSTALYDYRPRDEARIKAWFDAKVESGYPILGMETDGGELMGFASYGPFRAFPAYKYTVEHSVYVDGRFRKQGVARKLMQALIEEARRGDYHTMIGGIDASNSASVALHKSLGFVHCATIREAGFKFGRWLDLEFYQLILPTPEKPVDG
jgi:phosphinothricin acetyltransferase